MVFAKYDKWRYHSIFHYTGVKDLKHVFPGFGTAFCLFAGYLAYKNLIEPAFASHDHDDHHDHHVIIKGASQARELLENKHNDHHEHH